MGLDFKFPFIAGVPRKSVDPAHGKVLNALAGGAKHMMMVAGMVFQLEPARPTVKNDDADDPRFFEMLKRPVNRRQVARSPPDPFVQLLSGDWLRVIGEHLKHPPALLRGIEAFFLQNRIQRRSNHGTKIQHMQIICKLRTKGETVGFFGEFNLCF